MIFCFRDKEFKDRCESDMLVYKLQVTYNYVNLNFAVNVDSSWLIHVLTDIGYFV